MKIKINIFLLLLFLSVNTLLAQEFAVIADPDGYTNVRKENNAHSQILDKLKNGHLVCIMNPEGNWWNIDYASNKEELKVGYIYKDRFKFISTFEEIPLLKKSKNEVILGKGNFEIKLTDKEFEKEDHRFVYSKDFPDQVLKIDGKDAWGIDGNIPKREYKSIFIKYKNMRLTLPPKALENLFEPNLESTKINYDRIKDILYISTMNSDGAGSYLVVWKIEKGMYKERFIAYGF